jgi:hypothetical protein
MHDNQVLHLAIQPARSVIRDTVQNKFWIGGFVLFIAIFILVSSVLFHLLESSQSIDWLSSFYFTIINLTTVGFGDIVPKSNAGKILAIANSVIGVLSFSFLVAIIATALQPSGFTGTGVIDKSEVPRGARNSNSPSAVGDPNFEPFRQETLRFLSSLSALLGDPEQRHREVRIRLRLVPVEGEGADTTIEVDVFVHRWS